MQNYAKKIGAKTRADAASNDEKRAHTRHNKKWIICLWISAYCCNRFVFRFRADGWQIFNSIVVVVSFVGTFCYSLMFDNVLLE